MPELHSYPAVWQRYHWGQHSTLCRTRLIKAIGETAKGQKRLEDYKSRVDNYTADEIEKADVPKNQTSGGVSQSSVKLGPRDQTREYAQRALGSWKDELGAPKQELGQREERPRDAERTQPRVRGGHECSR